MKIASIITIADILAEPGAPLVSHYWADRQDGESYAAWRRRKDLERELAHVRRVLARLQRLYPDAWDIAQRTAGEET